MASSLQVSHPELCTHLSSPHVFGMLSLTYHPLCDNPDNNYLRLQDVRLFIMWFSQYIFLCTSSLLGPFIFLGTLFTNTLRLFFPENKIMHIFSSEMME